MKFIKIQADHLIITTTRIKKRNYFKQEKYVEYSWNLRSEKQNRQNEINLRQNSTSEQSQRCKGIIFGVSTEISNKEILSETYAIEARRISKMIDGQRVDQENVSYYY